MAVKYRNIHADWRVSGVYATTAAFLTGSNQTAAREGDVYYDTTLNQLRNYDGSSWSPAGQNGNSAGSLDDAAQIGAKITNTDQIEIERSYSSDALFVLDQNSTGTSARCLNLENASNNGSSITVDFASTNGFDIDGTSSSWYVKYTGDALMNSLLFNDSKSLKFGTGSDVTINWDASNLLIEALVDDTGQIRIGSTNAIDLSVYGSTNTNIALFDVSAALLDLDGWDLRLKDADILQFGDASGGDVNITWDGSNLLVEAATDNVGQIRIGSTNAMDMAVYGSTNSKILLFDASLALLKLTDWDMRFSDNDILQFGSTASGDISFQWDSSNFLIEPKVQDTGQIRIGSTKAMDFVIYDNAATGTITNDVSTSIVDMNGWDIRLQDDDYLLFGDSATAGATTDGTIRWDATNSVLEIIGSTTFEGATVTFDNDVTISGTLTMSGDFAPGSVSLGDTETLSFGDGTDYTISTAGSTAALIITAANANDAVHIGDGSVATDFLIDNITVAGADVWWDQSADTANGVWYFGKDDAGVDVYLYGATASAWIQWDYSADQLVVAGGAQITLNDNVELLLGTGASNAGDFSIASDGSSLLIKEIASAGKDVQLGVDGKGLDLKLFGETASSFVLWDQSADQLQIEASTLALGDGDAILLGDALGTGDFSISSTSAVLTIGQVVSGTGTIAMGVDGKGVDQKWFAETAGDYMLWDQDGNSNLGALIFEDSAIQFAGGNATYTEAISTDALLITATDHANAKVTWGDNGTNGLDQEWLSVTAGNLLNWDAGAETLKLTDVKCTMIGADSRGTILAITGIDTTGDTDTMTITSSGSGSGLKITAGEIDSVQETLTCITAQTAAMLEIDGTTTAGWTGAAGVGMVNITNDSTAVDADATMINILKTGNLAAANDGVCLEIEETGAAQATTYAVRIASTSNEALHVDAGEVLIDEYMTATLGYQTGIAQTMTAHTDGGAGSTILPKARIVNVTANNADANDWILLPASTIGQRLTIFCNSGTNFELRTPAASNDTINNVDADGGAAEYLCTDTDVIELVCHTATGWIGVSYTNLGAVRTAVIPDA